MDLKLQTRQTQTLSQRMIQSAEILQMTAQELNTYINETALENPVMEISDSSSGGPDRESIEQQQWLNSFNEENYYLYQRQNNDDDYDFKDSWNIDTDDGETLEDYLWSQLITGDFTQEEQEILKFMLECLDSRGYLEEDLEHIAEAFHVSMEKIEFLLLLVSARHFKRGGVADAFFFLQQERTVSRTEQASSPRNHVKLIVRTLLSGMMDKQDANTIAVCKLFQLCNYFIVVCVTVIVSADFPHLLERVNDNQPCIVMLFHKFLQLFIQSVAKITRRDRKE